MIARLYVVLESDRGLVLLDQHAAHERILFEQMLHRLEQNDQAPSQRLLLPETVEIPDHPWFIGVQYHPELKSRPFEPHPLFASFIEAAVEQSRLV